MTQEGAEGTPLQENRWNRLMAAFGMPASAETYNALVAAYSERHRHYHTGEHIDHCLRELDCVPELADDAAEVELALWFHDAIYNPYASDNEERSADLACELLTRNGAGPDRVRRVRAHILATRHAALADLDDSKLVVDIDLSILGVDSHSYARFETNVRREYHWVPGVIFRRKRAEILESFLARPQLYGTEPFRLRYELAARENLRRAIADLRA